MDLQLLRDRYEPKWARTIKPVVLITLYINQITSPVSADQIRDQSTANIPKSTEQQCFNDLVRNPQLKRTFLQLLKEMGVENAHLISAHSGVIDYHIEGDCKLYKIGYRPFQGGFKLNEYQEARRSPSITKQN